MLNKEEKCKELLEKIKQTPNNVIEEAIDELHIEYIKDSKEYIKHEIKTGKLINGYTDIHIFQTEVELLLKYIQHLEQKESILDKVTDKLNKNQASDYQALTEIEYRLRKMNRKEYDTNGHGRYLADLRDILLNRIEYQQEILNIIEGEKK